MDLKNNKNLQFKPFNIDYQSNLTTTTFDEILKNNRTSLPDINTSYCIYKTFFQIFFNELNKDRKYKYKELPIT